MSETVIFIVGVVVFLITVYGVVMMDRLGRSHPSSESESQRGARFSATSSRGDADDQLPGAS